MILVSVEFFMNISQKKIKNFQNKIFLFYQAHKRKLPWRATTNPYFVLLSEFMLQQTQVSRVITFYQQWINRWPTIQYLAKASRTEVLKAWMGLGYNTRALRLHDAVNTIVSDYDGNVLEAMKHYQQIPGVGKYTAHAVQIFSSNADLVTVDTNIRRIFIAEFHLPESISDKDLWMLAKHCLPKGRSRDWHNALMDYGALHLTSQKTGIKPKTRQTSFEGSDRQLRAQIIRLLLNHPASMKDLNKRFDVDQSRLKKILQKMIHEQIIIFQQNQYHLKNE